MEILVFIVVGVEMAVVLVRILLNFFHTIIFTNDNHAHTGEGSSAGFGFC